MIIGLVIGMFIGAVAGYIMACVFRTVAKDVLNGKPHVDHLSGNCPNCGEKLRNFGCVNYCWRCGQGLRWDGVIL